MFSLLLVASTALTVVLGYFEASRTCSGCQWIEDSTQRNNCYGYCSRRGRSIDASLQYVATDSCNDCPYEMDMALQGQCWDVCDGGMYGRRGMLGREMEASRYNDVCAKACQRDFGSCYDSCDKYAGRYVTPSRWNNAHDNTNYVTSCVDESNWTYCTAPAGPMGCCRDGQCMNDQLTQQLCYAPSGRQLKQRFLRMEERFE